MSKRRRFSRWRRLPGVYRFGDDKPTDPHQELQRLTLYVAGTVLDRAEMQAIRHGLRDAQEYCTEILLRAIDAEHVRGQMADVEARRGTLEGLHEIAEDEEYLAELSAASVGRDHGEPAPQSSAPVGPDAPATRPEITFLDSPDPAPPDPLKPPTPAGRAADVILRHAGQAGDDPSGFLPSLRRGESVPPEEVAELAQALQDLEREYRGTRLMDRGLTFALHRLAFESQILQTDAWPGAFDVWTVDMVRAVQEAVERILSGQDIRYYPPPRTAEPDRRAPTRPEDTP